ncbi:MAG: APC family permease [Gammaproteobacteria bacterium]|jgi:amino acid transporter
MTDKNPSLGLWTLAALVVGNMIGAGVFTTSGFALADLGSPAPVLAAWCIGGLLALCGAVSYGALCRLVPGSAGEYLYLSRLVHPAAGFIAGWVSLLAGFTAAIAYSALTFAAYAWPGQHGSAVLKLVATGLIAIAVLLHALRVRHGALVQNVAVTVKLILLIAFCGYSLFGPGAETWSGLAALREAGSPSVRPAAFALTLMWISFSYSGFNAAVYLAGEVPDASRVVPRALVLGTVLTVFVYLGLNAVFVLAPSFEAAAGQEDIAAVAARALGGQPLADAMRLLIALALFTSVSAMVMAGPRVYARMADDGLFPRALRFRGETPSAAIILQGTLAIGVVWFTGLRELLSYLGFTLGLSAAATVASLFLAVRREPNRRHVLPGYPWAPLVFVTFTLLFAALAATVEPLEMLAALVTIAAGALLYRVVGNDRERRRH